MIETGKIRRHIATRTVWFSVISSIVLGLASLLVGLSIYSNSLMQASISRTRSICPRAASSAQHGTDTVGLADDVMRVYNSLTPEQRIMVGTEKYRQHFQSLESVSREWGAYDVLKNLLMNFMGDVSRIYICTFDQERGAMVYLADVGGRDPAFPGDWESVPAAWVEKVTGFQDYEWDMDETPYDIQRSADGGRRCIAAFPIRDDNGVRHAYLIAELSINSVISEIQQYAIRVSTVVLALTVLIACFIGFSMKKNVATPINAIAGAAAAYTLDRKNGVTRSGHFSSLNIRTGDELENLSDTMDGMEKELIRHEDQIEGLLDSLVKALSAAIDDRSHYTAKHTRKMVVMAEAFFDWMEAHGNPWQYDAARRRVFIMSVGLHDVGKLTVPMHIMDKATRLGSGLEPILDRYTKIRLLNRIAMLEGRITEEEYRRKEDEAEKDLAFIRYVNTAECLSDEDLERVGVLASRTFTDEDGTERRILTDGEITMLSIRQGTLTAEERLRIQGHAASTWNILNQVDFPEQYAVVPKWAASHHELLNGKGYPNGLSGKDIPKEVRLLTILDIFETLTAEDRPYKASFSPEKSWELMEAMVRDGALDGELLAMFRESRAWETVLPSAAGTGAGTAAVPGSPDQA